MLTTWDRAIATVGKLIETARAQKKALMQQLLTGNRRLPGFDGAWHFRKISEISDRIQKKNEGGKEPPVLTISSTSGFVRQDEKYSRFMAGRSVENYVHLSRGEFAYNKGNSRTYQFGCVMQLQGFENGLVPHVYVCFRLKSGLCDEFYRLLFEADFLKPQLGRLVNTGVRNNGLLNITPKDFLSTKVPVPPIAEQQAIAQRLQTAHDEVIALHAYASQLREEKRALMQQLLTGKRRVSEEEPA